jgi:hypothetical protein
MTLNVSWAIGKSYGISYLFFMTLNVSWAIGKSYGISYLSFYDLKRLLGDR